MDEGDAVGAVLEKLLTSRAGGQPKLCQYTGRATLRRWLQVVLVRHLADTRPLPWREVPLTQAILAGIDSGADPAWRGLNATAREAFQAALAKALGVSPATTATCCDTASTACSSRPSGRCTR